MRSLSKGRVLPDTVGDFWMTGCFTRPCRQSEHPHTLHQWTLFTSKASYPIEGPFTKTACSSNSAGSLSACTCVQMVCAYLMATEGLSLEEAIVSVREKRRVICPNQGFYAQLQLWEQMGCKLDESNPTYRSVPHSCHIFEDVMSAVPRRTTLMSITHFGKTSWS